MAALPGMLPDAGSDTANGAKLTIHPSEPTAGSRFTSSADAAAAASAAFANGGSGSAADALRAAANKRTLQRKVQGMGMIGHIRRKSVIASTYGTEMSVEDDRHSPDSSRAHTIEDHGATFAGRERAAAGHGGAVKACCDSVCPIIKMDSKARQHWDKIQVIALMYVAVLVPIRTGFEIELQPFEYDWWLDLLVDLYFITVSSQAICRCLCCFWFDFERLLVMTGHRDELPDRLPGAF